MRKDGLLATAGRPEPEPPVPAEGLLVAMAVGNTNEGESLPAKPADDEELGQSVAMSWISWGVGVANLAWRTPCRWLGDVSDDGPGAVKERAGWRRDTWMHVLVHNNGGGCVGHFCGGLLLGAARDDCSLVKQRLLLPR